MSQEVQERVKELENETRVALQLAKLRQAAGITQEEMAKNLGVTQSAISKLEGGIDADITLGEIKGYARAMQQRIGVVFGKPLTHVESVKCHALSIRHHLEGLAKIADRDEEMQTHIQAFFGEAFFNILTILAECGEKLPGNGRDFEIRIEIVKQEPSRGAATKPKGPPAPAVAA